MGAWYYFLILQPLAVTLRTSSIPPFLHIIREPCTVHCTIVLTNVDFLSWIILQHSESRSSSCKTPSLNSSYQTRLQLLAIVGGGGLQGVPRFQLFTYLCVIFRWFIVFWNLRTVMMQALYSTCFLSIPIAKAWPSTIHPLTDSSMRTSALASHDLLFH